MALGPVCQPIFLSSLSSLCFLSPSSLSLSDEQGLGVGVEQPSRPWPTPSLLGLLRVASLPSLFLRRPVDSSSRPAAEERAGSRRLVPRQSSCADPAVIWSRSRGALRRRSTRGCRCGRGGSGSCDRRGAAGDPSLASQWERHSTPPRARARAPPLLPRVMADGPLPIADRP
jgi:hypothetical protein